MNIHEALVAAKKEIGAVKKEEVNQAQHFNFRGIDAVINACAPVFIKYGIIVSPEIVEHSYEVLEVGQRKTPMGRSLVIVKFTFHGPDGPGDFITAVTPGEAFDAGDKSVSKAMSVAYRIALLQTLSLPTTEPDPDSESFERSQGGVTVQSAVPRPVPKAAADNQDWGSVIGKTSSLDALRKVWKDAGAAGALQNKLTIGDENLTVQEYLYKRSDELTAAKSNSGS